MKDKDKCVAYLPTTGATEEQANTLCSGNALDNGMTLKDGVQRGLIPSSDYETAGLEVTYNGGGTDVVIPSEINGKKVVAIADYAFTTNGITPTSINNTKKAMPSYLYSGNKASIHKLWTNETGLGITSVVIPNTVTSIGDGAFMRNQLTSLIIPNSVTSIGAGAFSSNHLTEVTIPNSVTSIGGSAFKNNHLTEVTIPSSVTYIGTGAFANNRGIIITNNSSIKNSVNVWNQIVLCFYVDSITDNVIKISQNEGPC